MLLILEDLENAHESSQNPAQTCHFLTPRLLEVYISSRTNLLRNILKYFKKYF